jgi:hypothetical protein
VWVLLLFAALGVAANVCDVTVVDVCTTAGNKIKKRSIEMERRFDCLPIRKS